MMLTERWRARLIAGLTVSVFTTGVSLHGQLKVEGEGEDLLIKNATVMTVTQGTLENGSVLIRDGKIERVGHRKDLNIRVGNINVGPKT